MVGLLYKTDYMKEAERLLSDTNTYSLFKLELPQFITEATGLIARAQEEEFITKIEAAFLKKDCCVMMIIRYMQKKKCKIQGRQFFSPFP